MVAFRGLVVAVPLVGSVPLQPPEALQDSASVALHCKVVEVPLVTLVFLATRVIAGLATWVKLGLEVEVLLPVAEGVCVVWSDED